MKSTKFIILAMALIAAIFIVGTYSHSLDRTITGELVEVLEHQERAVIRYAVQDAHETTYYLVTVPFGSVAMLDPTTARVDLNRVPVGQFKFTLEYKSPHR